MARSGSREATANSSHWEDATPNYSSYRPPDIASIRTALAAKSDTAEPFLAHSDHASVALTLAGIGSTLQLCLIRRVEHPSDPWSGHMALPGGRASAGDLSAPA